MAELEIEQQERKVTGSDSLIVKEAASVQALRNYVAESVKNVLPEMTAEEQADSLDEKRLPLLWNLQK